MSMDFSTTWDFADPAGSEMRFRGLLAGAGDLLDRAEVLTQIGRALGLQRRFDEARAAIQKAEAIVAGQACAAGVRVLLERGRVTNTSGDPGGASPDFLAAWEMARSIGEDVLAVDAGHMLGIVERDEAGMAWNQRALELAQSSSEPAAYRWTASLRNNIGWWLHDHGRAAEALEQFKLAVADRERLGGRDRLLVARWCVARCLRTLGRVDEALAMQRELLAEHAARGGRDGFVHEEMGECLLLLRRSDEAAAHFAAAWRALSEPGPGGAAAVGSERLARLAELGGIRS